MKFARRLLLLSLIALPAMLVFAAWLMLDGEPVVMRKVEFTPEQMARAKALARAHDPRRTASGALRTVRVAAADVDLAANYALAPHGGGAKVLLQAGGLVFWASVPVPPNAFGRYLNVEGELRQSSHFPEFERVRVGRLKLPASFADWLLERALARYVASDDRAVAADMLQSVRFDPAAVEIVYRWRADAQDRLRQALVSPADEQRLHAYQLELVRVTSGTALPQAVPLRMLLEPLLRHAAQRSQTDDPVAENRAALIALAFYVNGRGVEAIAPRAREWPRANARKVTLGQRNDLAQHFTVSAALAAAAGTPLADAIGVYKEVEDSRGGSGFSFVDLTADRAGTLFGDQAIRSRATARSLQSRVAGGTAESDWMPRFADLPERMTEAEFKRRFGGVDEPRYRELRAEIERRIAALPLYR